MLIAENLSRNAGVPPVVALAPMTGVSDLAFRRIAARFGASYVVTEMVPCDGLVSRRAEAELRAAGAGLSRHVVQLVGREPSGMAEAARVASANGADVIDINFGCPAKRVVGGQGGSAMMREPARAVAIVEAVLRATSLPVTVKMRLGWDRASLNASDIARDAAAAGAAAVTVHGRTRQEFYAGEADWRAIADVVAAVPAPVIANGDVDGIPSARRCLALSGAAGVMIGRAATGQPWIVGSVAAALAGRAVAEPSPAERTDAAIEHYGELLHLYGRAVGTRHARKHLAAYADRAGEAGFGLSETDRRALVTTTEPVDAFALLRRLYDAPLARAA